MTSLKSLYDYKVMDQENILDIRSDTIYPISQSTAQQKYVFRLEPMGFLDKNSMLLFKLVNKDANQKRLNIHNGCLMGIKRATLSIGDFTLNDTDEAGKWSVLEHLSTMPRTVQNKYMSHFLGNSMHTMVTTVDAVSQNEDLDKIDTLGSLVVDPLKSGISFGGFLDGGSAEGAVYGVSTRINSGLITQTETDNTQCGVPLGLLFPCLQGRTIPLFLFQEYKIYITIYFNDVAEFVNDLSRDDYTTQKLSALSGSVEIKDVKLQVDYLIFPSSVQNQQLEQISKLGGYVMDFYDVSHIIKQLPASVDRVQEKQEMRIGVNDKEVHKIHFLKHMPNTAGRRNALFLGAQCDSMPQETVNWNVNGVDIYNEDLSSSAQHYEALALALDGYLDIERPCYHFTENEEWSALTSKWSGLAGTYKPISVDLRNGNQGILGAGTTIGQYPVILKYSRTAHASADDWQVPYHYNAFNEALSVDIFALTSRRAVIKQTPKGGQIVNVSY